MKHEAEDVAKILVTSEQIEECVERIAAEIDTYYADSENFLLLGILKGSVVFMGDLMRKITIPAQIDFMKVSSYGGSSVTSGNVSIILDLKRNNLEETDILIVEDIIDSGVTLSKLTEYLKSRGAKSVRTCTLLDKPSRRKVDLEADYTGFVIPDEFVIGYGLDYAERYRTLPFVGVLKREIYS